MSKPKSSAASTSMPTHGEEEGIDALADQLVARGSSAQRIIRPSLDDEVELPGNRAAPNFRLTHRRLPSETVLKQDWHNELTQFTFDLRELLEQAADEKSRAKVMRGMQHALEDESS